MTTWGCARCREPKTPDLACMDCKVVFYCSARCRDEDVSHKDMCYPSVQFEASASITSELFRTPQVQESEARQLVAAGVATGNPRVVSAREVRIDPRNFVTTRLRLDPRKRTSLSFRPDADIRYQISTGALQGTWQVPSQLNILDLLEGIDMFVLIAPGPRMLASLESRRARAQGTPVRDLQAPDLDLIRYAQSIRREEEGDAILYIVEWYPN
ncbi:hypothetical protein C8A03DRAFT_38902 [Achaetomium macrosporum]|uniref:MYND-type domain-containing protein n=1 Tax=Achaetomium macrosporum TaxID=79813 RepID=A0AAN7C142_9PEZI|nr:hypothetical protein C8A03DRAFT_38902 [Achaetomium macrosporum]